MSRATVESARRTQSRLSQESPALQVPFARHGPVSVPAAGPQPAIARAQIAANPKPSRNVIVASIVVSRSRARAHASGRWRTDGLAEGRVDVGGIGVGRTAV